MNITVKGQIVTPVTKQYKTVKHKHTITMLKVITELQFTGSHGDVVQISS